MNRNRKDIIWIATVILVMLVLVVVRQITKNDFPLSADQLLEKSLLEKHTYLLSDLPYLEEVGGLIIDLGDEESVESLNTLKRLTLSMDDLLSPEYVSVFSDSSLVKVILSKDISEAVNSWTILTQMGYSNLFILDLHEDLSIGNDTIYDGNEFLRHNFVPDSSMNQ